MTMFNPQNPADRYFAEWVRDRDRLQQTERELELAKRNVATLMDSVRTMTERAAESKKKVLESVNDWGNSAIAELLKRDDDATK